MIYYQNNMGTNAELTFVLDYCSCYHMIHIPGHRKQFRSHRRIPKVEETKCSRLSETQEQNHQ